MAQVTHGAHVDGGYGSRRASSVPRQHTPSSRAPRRWWFHGDGFTLGDFDSADDICGRMALLVDVVVVSVDSRKAAAHRWPTAHHDALDAVGILIRGSEIAIDTALRAAAATAAG